MEPVGAFGSIVLRTKLVMFTELQYGCGKFFIIF